MKFTPFAASKLLLAVAATAATASLTLPVSATAKTETTSSPQNAGCESLADLKLRNTTIVSATTVAQGAATFLTVPDVATLPAFCRVVAHVRSAPDSDIAVEVWLPISGWSGVFHGNGNGGFAGVLQGGYASMVSGLRRGYASATTDTGTAPATPLDGDALVGHRRKWKDWGKLSTHVMTVTGKAIATAYYGRPATRSYYTGCSTGGQQGLIEALYYPKDYDGILVGAPVINRTWGHAAVAWDFAAANRTAGSRISEAKLNLLNSAAIAACQREGFGLAGDAFVTDPMRCRFDPHDLICQGADSDTCLTPDEVATARAFYTGPTTKDGRPGFFGWLPGSEGPGIFGWSFLQTASPNGQPQFGGLFKWVFGSNWDWRTFDVDHDMPIVDATLARDVNDATKGSLRAFKARGGKLIIYHGLADTLVPPGQSVAFYDRQADALGGLESLEGTARLFMVPGVMHCGGGAGPDSFNSALGWVAPPPVINAQYDLFSALIDWANHGEAPTQVIATKFAAGNAGTPQFQRPVCAYPAIATYNGSGSTADAENFTCRVPPRQSVADAQ